MIFEYFGFESVFQGLFFFVASEFEYPGSTLETVLKGMSVLNFKSF